MDAINKKKKTSNQSRADHTFSRATGHKTSIAESLAVGPNFCFCFCFRPGHGTDTDSGRRQPSRPRGGTETLAVTRGEPTLLA